MTGPTDSTLTPPHVAMLATEYVYNRVGGLGAHIRGLAPPLGDRLPLDLVLPCFDSMWPRAERVGRFGHVHRVDAERPQPGPDYDRQVWAMNDRISDYIVGLIEKGARFQLVHAHDWLVGYSANLLREQRGIPLVVTIHATEYGRVRDQVYTVDLSRRIHLAEMHLMRNADLLITTSEFMRKELMQVGATGRVGDRATGRSPLRGDRATGRSPLPGDKIAVIPNGIDSSGFRNLRQHRSEWASFRQQYAAPDEPLAFYVGRLVWEKGPDVLVDAMHLVRQQVPGARAVIAGAGSMKQDLAGKIAALGLQEHVHLVGFIDDETRDRFYAVSDVAVFPSRYEPFGIVALEAMAAGVPVVVGAGGLAEVVAHGVTGLVAAPGSGLSLSECILEVFRDPAATNERVRRARVVVEEQYTWERIAAQTVEAYRRVLSEIQVAEAPL